VDALAAHIDQNINARIEELSKLCAIPSVSARRDSLKDCAAAVRAMLQLRGFDVRLIETGGQPVVYGELGDGPRSLLLYNHYDVQPPDPLELWTTPPFQPSRRDGALYARGAIDDKGEIMSRLAALDAVLAVLKRLPYRVKFLIEGEEEIGSPNLESLIREHAALLRADACIWEAGGCDENGRPEIVLGLRGLLYVEMSVRSLEYDAHSGHAHALPSAAWRLVWALSSLKNQDARVLIPGFYEGCRCPSLNARQPIEDLQSAVFSPTCNISGVSAGYTDHGSKTIIPAEARCKIDFRLVPDQDPEDVAVKLRAHLDRLGFDDVKVVTLDRLRPAMSDPGAAIVRLAAQAGKAAWGIEPAIVPLAGGSGPMAFFVELLKMPIVSIGCSYPGARKHAPNEHVRLGDFARGAKHLARIFASF